MAWLSRVNFVSSDTLSFTDINNLGNDIRAWGDNVNGGGYTLSNVVVSGSAGTLATISGGSGAASTLTIQSTSGAGTSDAILFKTASQSERMRILSTGNVGIGTSSPDALLTVNGVGAFGDGSASAPSIANTGDLNTGLWFPAADTIAASTNGSERMRINSTGDVLVGSATDAGNALRYLDIYNTNTGSSAGSIVRLITSNSAGTGTTSADIVKFKTGLLNIANNDTSGQIAFGTGGSERMRIDSSGNVGIGTPSPAYQLQLSTDSAAKPTTNTWTIASDSRIKTVKGEYQKGLAEICQVRPVRYEYNGKAGFTADSKEQISILAQELMQVFPECVDTFKGKLEEDGPEIDLYNYNGHAITFALINAIKELKAKIDILEARN
jgi:hypothetical protein